MVIYTKTGDQGFTRTMNQQVVPKDDARMKMCGIIDECTAHIGVLLGFVHEDQSELFVLERDLAKIQKQLFCIAVEISGNGQKYQEYFIKPENVTFLEKRIDWLCSRCTKSQSFILPGGSFAASYAHVCRAYVRRMERYLVRWHRESEQDVPLILTYANRLSDYFFTVGRYINEVLGVKEVTWP